MAGLLFALFEMIAAALMQNPNSLFMPLRMIGAIVLGPAALEPTYSLGVAAVTGVLLHLTLSVIFAFVFAALVSPAWSSGELALAGMAFGFCLWVVNFYGIASVAGWSWFPQRTHPIMQVVAHAFFFGCPLGWLLARSRLTLAV
jgi:uncharacterized membrane protein YagU involved in acid resistance